jgi:hypothetical protein
VSSITCKATEGRREQGLVVAIDYCLLTAAKGNYARCYHERSFLRKRRIANLLVIPFEMTKNVGITRGLPLPCNAKHSQTIQAKKELPFGKI